MSINYFLLKEKQQNWLCSILQSVLHRSVLYAPFRRPRTAGGALLLIYLYWPLKVIICKHEIKSIVAALFPLWSVSPTWTSLTYQTAHQNDVCATFSVTYIQNVPVCKTQQKPKAEPRTNALQNQSQRSIIQLPCRYFIAYGTLFPYKLSSEADLTTKAVYHPQ